MKRAEKIFTIFLFLFSLVVIREGVSIPKMSEFTIGPGLLPLIIGIMMAIFSIVLFISNFKREKTTDKPFITKDGLVRLSMFIILLIGSLLLNQWLGLVIPLILFMTLIFRFIEKYSWFTSIRVSVISNIIFYLLFNTWLGVPLPGINL